MKRFEVWIDCEDKDENDVRRRVKEALDGADVDYTILGNSVPITKKGSQK